MRVAPLPPGLDGLRAILMMPAWRADPIRYFSRLAARHGDVARFRLGPFLMYLLSHPDPIRQVLQRDYKRYDKSIHGYVAMRSLFGNGLLTSEGEFWRRQRRMIQPAFQRERVARHFDGMVAEVETLLDAWDALPEGTPFEASSQVTALTLRVVTRSLFGAQLSVNVAELEGHLDLLHRRLRQKMTTFDLLGDRLPTRRNRQIAAARQALERQIQHLILTRRDRPEAHDDLLTTLILARDPHSGEAMSDQQLRDEVMTFFLAGHETVAQTLAWSLMLLATHPAAAAAVRAEAIEVCGERRPVFGDLTRLDYTQRVVKEALRLYPPVWVFARRATEDGMVGGFTIKRRTGVVIAPWLVHRHPRLWPDPLRFDPDRFLPAAEAERPRFAWIPFGGGPHICIGNSFALMESTVALAMIMRRSELSLARGPVRPEPMVTLRPRGGLWLTRKSP